METEGEVCCPHDIEDVVTPHIHFLVRFRYQMAISSLHQTHFTVHTLVSQSVALVDSRNKFYWETFIDFSLILVETHCCMCVCH